MKLHTTEGAGGVKALGILSLTLVRNLTPGSNEAGKGTRTDRRHLSLHQLRGRRNRRNHSPPTSEVEPQPTGPRALKTPKREENERKKKQTEHEAVCDSSAINQSINRRQSKLAKITIYSKMHTRAAPKRPHKALTAHARHSCEPGNTDTCERAQLVPSRHQHSSRARLCVCCDFYYRYYSPLAPTSSLQINRV